MLILGMKLNYSLLRKLLTLAKRKLLKYSLEFLNWKMKRPILFSEKRMKRKTRRKKKLNRCSLMRKRKKR